LISFLVVAIFCNDQTQQRSFSFGDYEWFDHFNATSAMIESGFMRHGNVAKPDQHRQSLPVEFPNSQHRILLTAAAVPPDE
jgi:hypothetical protein